MVRVMKGLFGKTIRPIQAYCGPLRRSCSSVLVWPSGKEQAGNPNPAILSGSGCPQANMLGKHSTCYKALRKPAGWVFLRQTLFAWDMSHWCCRLRTAVHLSSPYPFARCWFVFPATFYPSDSPHLYADWGKFVPYKLTFFLTQKIATVRIRNISY